MPTESRRAASRRAGSSSHPSVEEQPELFSFRAAPSFTMVKRPGEVVIRARAPEPLISVQRASEILFGLDRKVIYRLLEDGTLEGEQPGKPADAPAGAKGNWKWVLYFDSVMDYRERIQRRRS